MVNERGGVILQGPQPEQVDPTKHFVLQQDGTTTEVPLEDLWQYLPDAMTVSNNDEQEGEQ